MIVLAATLAVFVTLIVVGLGATAVARGSHNLTVVDVLLAPATGIALIMAIIIPLNRAGIGVDRFAIWITIVISIGSIASLWRFRATISPAVRKSAIFGCAALLSLFIVASPMISSGSNWFSYANDDGVNYALSAERMRMGGLYDAPPLSTFASNSDIRLDYYFLNGAPSERYGVDELLALGSAIFQMTALQSLMPLMIVLNMASLLAAGALVYRGAQGHRVAIVCSFGLALSAVAAFSTADQLLGQAAGLVFLSAAIVRCTDPAIVEARSRERLALAILAVISVCGLLFSYPELALFAFATITVYHLARVSANSRARGTFLALVAGGSAIVLNEYIRNVLFVIAARFVVNVREDLNVVFPYFLIPTGVANVFGIMPMASFPSEPWISLGILIGLIFCGFTVGAIVWRVRAKDPTGYLCAVFLCAGIAFYFHRGGVGSQRTGFALFKLVLYSEPAIIALLATALVALMATRWKATRPIALVGAAVFVCLNISSLSVYVAASRSANATTNANFTEVRNISGGRLFDHLAAMRQGLNPDDIVISDTFDAVIAKIEAFYGRGSAGLAFPSSPEESVISYGIGARSNPFFDHSRDTIIAQLVRGRRGAPKTRGFVLSDLLHESDRFMDDGRLPPTRNTVWVTGKDNSPFNGMRSDTDTRVADIANAPNILAFEDSSLGLGYFAHGEPTAIYASEPDYFDSKQSMSGAGRYMLFEVINPRPPLRFRLSFTETLRNDGEARLPRASIYGTERVFFAIHGRGSAVAYSGPVTPRVIAGHAYVLLDIGAKPVRFTFPRTGLMRLWGSDVPIESRLIAAFVRDLSIVSDEALPSDRLASFPADLLTESAHYSGLYEDGWASEDVEATLHVGSPGEVQLDGEIPLINDPQFKTKMQVFVDGFPDVSKDLSVGVVRMSILTGAGTHTIRLRFSAFQRLPKGDNRPVTLRISSIGS